MFPDHKNEVKWEINKKNKFRKFTNVWKLNSSLGNAKKVKNKSQGKVKMLAMDKTEDGMCQSVRNSSKAILEVNLQLGTFLHQ